MKLNERALHAVKMRQQDKLTFRKIGERLGCGVVRARQLYEIGWWSERGIFKDCDPDYSRYFWGELCPKCGGEMRRYVPEHKENCPWEEFSPRFTAEDDDL